MKKICVFFLAISLIFLSSCSSTRSAHELVSEFVSLYGMQGTVFSAEVAEGERGYIDEDFFRELFAASPDPETESAIFLSSSLDGHRECGVFVTQDASSELYATELVLSRIEFLRDMGYAEDYVLIRRGGVVFYSTFEDTELAARLWKRVDITD